MPEVREKSHWIMMVFYLAAAGLIFYAGLANRRVPPERVTYSEFLTQVREGKVEAVRITNSEFIGELKGAGQPEAPHLISTPRLPATDESWVIQELEDREIRIVSQPQITKWWNALLGWLFPLLMVLIFFSIVSRSKGAQSGFSSVGKSRAKIYDQ